MTMLWSEICASLRCPEMETAGYATPKYDYVGAFRLTDTSEELLSDGVYFGTVKDYHSLVDCPAEATFILFADEPLGTAPNGHTVGVFKNADDYAACFASIQDLFAKDNRIRKRIGELVEQVSSGMGLSTIVNMIADMYASPVSIADNAYTLVVASDNYEDQSIPLNKQSKNEHIPQTIKTLLKHRGSYLPTIKSTDATFITWLDEGSVQNNAYLTLVHIKGVPIASFCVFPKEELPAFMVARLPQIASVISTELQKNDFYLANKSARYASLLNRLIDNPLHQDIGSLASSFELLGHTLKQYKYVLYADLKNECLNVSQTRTLAEELRHCINNSIYVIRDGNIIYLSSRSDNAGLSQEELDCWNEIAEVFNIKIGISSQFEDLLMTKTYIMQAQMAIRTGREFDNAQSIYPFDTYRMADVIASINDHEILFSFRYPPLMHLIKSDLENGTYFTYTLYRYLQDPTNPAKICEDLFIHKNTLYYRLNKARKIMDIDFTAAEEIMQLQFTFLLLQYQGKFEQLVVRG